MRKKIKAKQYALLAPQFVKSLLNDRLALFIILSLLVSFALSLLADLTSFVNNAAQPVQFILPFFHLLICIWLYLLRKKQEPKYFKYLLVFYQIARIVLLVALVLLFLLLLLFGLALLNSAGVVNPENSVNPYQLLSFIAVLFIIVMTLFLEYTIFRQVLRQLMNMFEGQPVKINALPRACFMSVILPVMTLIFAIIISVWGGIISVTLTPSFLSLLIYFATLFRQICIILLMRKARGAYHTQFES